MRAFRRLIDAIEAEGSAALVTLARVEGSSPREAGARMVVRPSGGFHGTIGGGALEFAALDAAQAALKAGLGPALRRSLALGPELGQCCGGRVEWRVETFDASDLDDLSTLAIAEGGGSATLEARLGPNGRVERALQAGEDDARRTRRLGDGGWVETIGTSVRPVYLFGAGHVGRALALALAPLPFAVRWIDSRRNAFPAAAPANVALVFAPEPAAEIAAAPDAALIVVMTHSHALDLEIVAAALSAGRFGFVGLIGSLTKRARFLSQMRAASVPEDALARLVCPIGAPVLRSKDPAVIAASTAAQLLMVSETLEAEGDGRQGDAIRRRGTPV
jgi:xanthine dehydrogenase accessory factor